MTFPAYPEVKDSGVEWLGEVPAHWEVRRLGVYGDFIAGSGFPHDYQGESSGDYPFYKVSDTNREDNGVYLKSAENYVDKETAKKLGARIAPAGGIMFPKVGAALLGNKRRVLTCEAITDNNTLVFYPNDGDSKYWFYWLSVLDFGQISNPGPVPSVNESQLREFPSICPPKKDQIAIAAFLDHETAKIDALVREQQRLIELLKEKRQAVISHAVTKGLDPDVPMKDSGVEWLGEVPEHWDVVRLGAIYKEAAEKGLAKLPVLRVSIHHGVSDRELNEEESDRKITRIEDREKYKRVRPGDLVYNMMRAWQGGFGAVMVDGLVSPAYVVARPLVRELSEYVEHLLRTATAVEEMRKNSYGITDFRLRLYWDQFKSIQVAIPPQAERIRIMTQLEKAVAESRALEKESEKAICLLAERRSALISAAVTGKIDVRHWRPPADESAYDPEVRAAGLETLS